MSYLSVVTLVISLYSVAGTEHATEVTDMTVFWSRVQHHVTTSLIKLADVATILGSLVTDMTVFWSHAQHHVTTSLMKLAVGERNVATNLGIISGCVEEYYFSSHAYCL